MIRLRWSLTDAVRDFIDWEARFFLAEESWSFLSELDVGTLENFLRNMLSHSGHDDSYTKNDKIMKRLTGRVDEEQVYLRYCPSLLPSLIGCGAYFFEGRLVGGRAGSKVCGNYRTKGFGRIFMFAFTNIIFAFMFLGGALTIYFIFSSMDHGQMQLREQDVLMGLGLMGTGILVQAGVWLIGRWGKLIGIRGRRTVYRFLQSVAESDLDVGDSRKTPSGAQ